MINKPKGSFTSSKSFSKATIASRPAQLQNKYVSGSGVGATSVSTRRAKLIRATHNSSSSSNISFTIPSLPEIPLAPALVSVSSKTLTSITFTFTQATNGTPAISNYKYSTDNGVTYTLFSPAKTTSPVTISGLTSNTTYNIILKSVNSNGDSEPSNTLTETTYAQVNYDRFTTVGLSTWTAPTGVSEVEYLVVGGGGGSGSTYSDIEVINSVSFVSSSPGAGIYWINSAVGSFYGYLFKGSTLYTSSRPVRLTAPQVITPNGAVYAYNKWYDFEIVYSQISYGFPQTSNVVYVLPQGTPSATYSNNVSAGSGGGGGGYIKTSALFPNTKYSVVAGTTYNVYVGAGGAEGTASAGVENNGSNGEASYFDTITASGGSGGNKSRTGFNQNGGGGFYSSDIMGGKGGAGGARNAGSVINSEAYQWNSTVLRGTYGGSGAYLNFDGSGTVIYGAGGNGGDANTAVTETTSDNIGKGARGTGATLNSYNSGNSGGSGIVIIKYYT